ncbi:hypothetical protein Salat_1665000 [Sesamum alatum]|uniref:CCHC-type domain-containing protein n=1 Tax=Sesamum alatum TaxID=300844 RepID=A0AAE2CJY9_9LAMI|nr:hypothetical protein Salat_1665000 [Sesamum alatum]
MESDILQFDSVLSLTEDEAAGVIIPQAALDKGSSAYRLTLVGRLLSHRTVLFHALKGSLVHLIQATRGMVVHKVSESRFCLVFSHQEDLRRVLDLRPWIFDKNLLIFQPLAQSDDPLSVNLDWCPFFVHIHDLPFGQRTLAVIQHIGGCVGSWLSDHAIEQDISFYETVRIRININVTKPLKRALRICSKSGEESMIRFSYERLPNFCYLCGKLGHISRFCDLRFDAQFSDPGLHTPYGAWLRAVGPSKRLGLQSDAIRPTYVWNSSSRSRSLHGSRRGANIFGMFPSTGGGAGRASPETGAASPSSPVISERLGGLDGDFGQQQLHMEVDTLQFSKEMGHHGEDTGHDAGPNHNFPQDFMMGLFSTQPNLAQQSAPNLRSGPSLPKAPLTLIDESTPEHETSECSPSPHFSGRRFSSPCSHQSHIPTSNSPHAVGFSLDSLARLDCDVSGPSLIEVPVVAPPNNSPVKAKCLPGGSRFSRGRA